MDVLDGQEVAVRQNSLVFVKRYWVRPCVEGEALASEARRTRLGEPELGVGA